MAEVVDTNVLVVATGAVLCWKRPRIPTDDPMVIKKVHDWVAAFRADATRQIVMDFPLKTILEEYGSNLPDSAMYGRRVVQHKFDTGAMLPVDLEYWMNGFEAVAVLPDEVKAGIHDLGDHKMVAAAVKAGAPIVSATDSDWEQPGVVSALQVVGVEVMQILTAAQRATCKTRKASP